MNLLLSDDEKLKVFKNDGLYLPTKKIGKNNPKADEIAEANEARKEWNSLVDEALFYRVPAKHIKVIKYYKIIKASKRLSNVKTNLIDTNALPYSSFIKSAGSVFLDAVEKAIECLKGLIEIFKAIIEPKKTHDEKTYKQYKKVYVVVNDLISEQNNVYSKINHLENRLSLKEYKLIGGKKQLQGDIMSLEKECDRIQQKINKAVHEVGEGSVDDVIRRFRDLERVKDAYESNLERQKEAKMFLVENVKEYMKTVKEDKVEAPEREKKYLFTNKGFASYNKRLVYKKGRDDIHSIDDLVGKKVSAGQGSNTAAILETYNAEHDNKIDIVYSNGATNESIYDDVMNGRLDAIVATKKTFKKYNEAFGGGYDINEDSYFSESQAYFMLAQGEEQLRDDMDTALKSMKEDGTLTKLSIEYTGSDYNSEE